MPTVTGVGSFAASSALSGLSSLGVGAFAGDSTLLGIWPTTTVTGVGAFAGDSVFSAPGWVTGRNWTYVSVKVAGVEYGTGYTGSGYVECNSVRIVKGQSQTIPVATFTMRNVRPSIGQKVYITAGPNGQVFFGGYVTSTRTSSVRPASTTTYYNVTCSGFGFLLTLATVTQKFTNTTAGSVLSSLIALVPGVAMGGITFTDYQINEISFSGDTVAAAVNKLLERANASYQVGVDGVFIAYNTSSTGTPEALTYTHSSMMTFDATEDVSQHINRQKVEGGGGSAIYDTNPNETKVPVTQSDWFPLTAGAAVAGDTQEISFSGLEYNSISTGGVEFPSSRVVSSGGSMEASSTYFFEVTAITDLGESATLGSSSFSTTASNKTITFSGFGNISALPTLIGSTTNFGTYTGIRVYLSKAGSSIMAGMIGEVPADGSGTLVWSSADSELNGAVPPRYPNIPANYYYMTGVSGLISGLAAGDTVNVLEQANNSGAQDAFLAAFGVSSGIVEGPRIRNQLLGRVEAAAVANAELNRRSNVSQYRIKYSSYDTVAAEPGRALTVNMPSPTSIAQNLIIVRTTVSFDKYLSNQPPLVVVDEATLPNDISDYTVEAILRKVMDRMPISAGSPRVRNQATIPATSQSPLPPVVPDLPTVSTSAASSVTSSGATLNGTGNPKGFVASVYFEYGTTTAYGSTTATQSLGSGTANSNFLQAVTGLTASTTYHFRAVITNAVGTVYGSDTTLATAAPGISWSEVTQSPSLQLVMQATAWSPSLALFCAVGGSGTIYTSTDGSTWTTRTAPESNNITDVCWSPGISLFVAVCSAGTHRVFTSPDGVTWTARTASAANAWVGVCWSSSLSLFVAVAASGTNRAMTSPDGITWTGRAISSRAWTDVVWSPTLATFCAVGSQTSVVYSSTSTDGITWSEHGSLPSGTQWGNNDGGACLAWSEALQLFVGIVKTNSPSSGDYTIFSSTDGAAWTSVTWPNAATDSHFPECVCSDEEESQFVIGGLSTSTFTHNIYTWNGTTFASVVSPGGNTNRRWLAIAVSPNINTLVAFDRQSGGTSLKGTY